MKDDRIFAIKVNKDRKINIESAAKDTSTKVVSKTEPEKVEVKKAKPEKVEAEKTEPEKVEPEKVEAEKVKPEKVEPKKTEPKKAKSGDDGYVTEFGTFYSIEELASFFRETKNEWDRLHNKEKEYSSGLFDLLEEEKKKNEDLKASVEKLTEEGNVKDGTIAETKSHLDTLQTLNLEGALIKDLASDAGDAAKSAVEEFKVDVKKAGEKRSNAVGDAQSRYNSVDKEYEAIVKKRAAAEKSLKKKLKEIDDDYHEEVKVAAEKLTSSLVEELNKKKIKRVEEAEERKGYRDKIYETERKIERSKMIKKGVEEDIERDEASLVELKKKAK